MSSALHVYAVSIEELHKALGSGDEELIAQILECQEDFLQTIDEIDDEAEFSCAEAVGELIRGELNEDAPRYFYGYALEAICFQLGDELPNICPISRASTWIEEVDVLLKHFGIPVRLLQLIHGGSPVRIPEPDDYPYIGSWTSAEVTAAKAAFAGYDSTDIRPDMEATLQQIRGWVEAAAKRPGNAVVGFLS